MSEKPRSLLEQFRDEPGRQILEEGNVYGPFTDSGWVVQTLALRAVDRATEKPDVRCGVEVTYRTVKDGPDREFVIDFDECDGLVSAVRDIEHLRGMLPHEPKPYVRRSFATRSGVTLGYVYHSTGNDQWGEYSFVKLPDEDEDRCEMIALKEISYQISDCADYLRRLSQK